MDVMTVSKFGKYILTAYGERTAGINTLIPDQTKRFQEQSEAYQASDILLLKKKKANSKNSPLKKSLIYSDLIFS